MVPSLPKRWLSGPRPVQPRRRIHRLQQFYIWLLYGVLLAKWQFVDDFKNVAQGRVADGP